MSIEENKAIARRFPLEIANQGKIDLLDELTAPGAIDHQVPPGWPPNVESTKKLITMLRAAFPDLEYTIDFEVAEGNKVMQRLTGRGTMTGEFMGYPPTGKRAVWTESHIVRFANGKVVEHWGNADQVGMLQSQPG